MKNLLRMKGEEIRPRLTRLSRLRKLRRQDELIALDASLPVHLVDLGLISS
jgi:hypothetical protein